MRIDLFIFIMDTSYIIILNINMRILLRWVKSERLLCSSTSRYGPRWWNIYLHFYMVCCFLIIPTNVINSPNLHCIYILNIMFNFENCVLRGTTVNSSTSSDGLQDVANMEMLNRMQFKILNKI